MNGDGWVVLGLLALVVAVAVWSRWALRSNGVTRREGLRPYTGKHRR